MFVIKVLIIAILSFVLTLFLPWYMPFIVSFIVGLTLSNRPGNNFLSGLIGVGFFWLIYALYLDISNAHVLSRKVALLFSDSLNTAITGAVLIMVTTFLGGLLGGLSAMAGAMILDNDNRKRSLRAIKQRKYTLKIK